MQTCDRHTHIGDVFLTRTPPAGSAFGVCTVSVEFFYITPININRRLLMSEDKHGVKEDISVMLSPSLFILCIAFRLHSQEIPTGSFPSTPLTPPGLGTLDRHFFEPACSTREAVAFGITIIIVSSDYLPRPFQACGCS